jgi:hypothetical protein
MESEETAISRRRSIRGAGAVGGGTAVPVSADSATAQATTH